MKAPLPTIAGVGPSCRWLPPGAWKTVLDFFKEQYARGGDFEICIMNADGRGQIQLTDNTVGDLTSSWSPDGRRIVVHRPVSPSRFQLWLLNVDGSGELQLTDTPGLNGFPNWGELRARTPK